MRYPLAWLVRAPRGALSFMLLIAAVSAVPSPPPRPCRAAPAPHGRPEAGRSLRPGRKRQVPELAASVGVSAGEAAGGDPAVAEAVAGAGGLAFSLVESVFIARLMLVPPPLPPVLTGHVSSLLPY